MRKFIDVFHGIEYDQLFPLCKKSGFDGFFSGENYANDPAALNAVAALARTHDLTWETSHSTIPKCQTVWSRGEAGDRYCGILLANIDNCKRHDIPLLVVHISPDFSKEPIFELGIKRLEAVVEYAKSSGVRIAFENINSSEYLLDTLAYFNDPYVGFCYDCGHEACHTPNERYLPKLGNRLFCTHLHDNDGKNDCHWLPFDGSVDFKRISDELRACGYKGNLTLELCYNERYSKKYTQEEFVQEAYVRVERLREMINSK